MFPTINLYNSFLTNASLPYGLRLPLKYRDLCLIIYKYHAVHQIQLSNREIEIH